MPVTQQCNLSSYFYAIHWPEYLRNRLFSVAIGQKRQLTGENVNNNMRNVTCVGTQTLNVPTREALLFIFYAMILVRKSSLYKFI